MQREKTLLFWDHLYTTAATKNGESQPKEWILKPNTETLLKAIWDEFLDTVDKNSNSGNPRYSEVMEIGCGSSRFSLTLWEYFQRNIKLSSCCDVNVTATDVSSVCIQQNDNRDKEIMNRSIKDSFCYKVLNVLDSNKLLNEKFAMILDKGCLDTFLFRSRVRGKKTAGGQNLLVQRVLDNVHSWLQPGGKYIIFTPRAKIRTVRDFKGFSSVKIVMLDSSNVITGDLDGNTDIDKVYMHICIRDNQYTLGDSPFRGTSGNKLPVDDDYCNSCGVSFLEFRKGENTSGRGEAFWSRRWNGHIVHCKGG